jgi:hypothetical protein
LGVEHVPVTGGTDQCADPATGLHESHRGQDPQDLPDDRSGHGVPLDEVVDVENSARRQLAGADGRTEMIEHAGVQPGLGNGWGGCVR